MPPPPAPPSSWLLLIFENDANQRVWGAGGGGLVRLRAPRSLLQLPASPAPGADARPCPPDEAGSHYGGPACGRVQPRESSSHRLFEKDWLVGVSGVIPVMLSHKREFSLASRPLQASLSRNLSAQLLWVKLRGMKFHNFFNGHLAKKKF